MKRLAFLIALIILFSCTLNAKGVPSSLDNGVVAPAMALTSRIPLSAQGTASFFQQTLAQPWGSNGKDLFVEPVSAELSLS